MMKNKKLALIIVFFVLAVLTACSKESKDVEIKQEIEEAARTMIDSDEIITDIEIIEKDFTKKEEYGRIYCKLVSEKDDTQYIRYLEALYTHEKKYGWVLAIVNKVDEEKWEVTPLAGVNEDKIIDLLDGEKITINGDTWDLTKDNIISMSINNHNTLIEDKNDIVEVTLTIDDYVQQAKGNLTINFVFDEEWEINTIEGEEGFSTFEKDGSALNLSDEDLIGEIIKEELKYGALKTEEYTDNSTEQVISMSQNEISNFVINSEETSSKGMHKKYDCSFTLTKRSAVFDVNALIEYEYINPQGWTNFSVNITPQIESLNINGDWTGTYNDAGPRLDADGDCVLSINTIDENGNITGVYSYVPYEQNEYSEPGSFNVSGTIDMTTLLIKLSPGDWVVEPQDPRVFAKIDISAQLMVDENTMYGTGQEGSPFVISKGDF